MTVTTTRKGLAYVAILCALLMLLVTLTVPAIVAAGPAVLTLGFGLAAWALWP